MKELWKKDFDVTTVELTVGYGSSKTSNNAVKAVNRDNSNDKSQQGIASVRFEAEYIGQNVVDVIVVHSNESRVVIRPGQKIRVTVSLVEESDLPA